MENIGFGALNVAGKCPSVLSEISGFVSTNTAINVTTSFYRKRQFCWWKCGWKCPDILSKISVFVATNMARNVLTRTIQRNHTFKCGNAVSNSGHWLGSAFAAMPPPSPQPPDMEYTLIFNLRIDQMNCKQSFCPSQQEHTCGRHWSCHLNWPLTIHLAWGDAVGWPAVRLYPIFFFASCETRLPSCRRHRSAGRWKTWSTTTRRPRSRSERPPPTTPGVLQARSCPRSRTWPSTWWPSPRSWGWSGSGSTTTVKTGDMFIKLWPWWTTWSKRALSAWPRSAGRAFTASRRWETSST